MQRIPPELLLRVLASLPSKQMVLFRRVKPEWEELMGETTALWKSLVIRREEGIEWNPSILDLFLLKSQGTMEEICLRLTIPATEILNIVEKLQITKNTLRSLSLVLIRPDSEHGRKLIEFVTLNCPNLVSLKVLYAHWIPSQLTVEHDRLEVELSYKTNRKSLWVHYLPQSLLGKDSNFLQNLTTLSLERVENQGELRKILQVTNNHLRSLHFRTSEKGDGHLEDLILESLSRVEVAPPFSSIPNEFPSWLKCPNLNLLVLDGIGECASIESFPQKIKELWCLPDRWTLPSDDIVKGLLKSFGSSIPNLERLKLTQGFPFQWGELLNVLKSRKEAKDLQSIKNLVVEFDGSWPEEEVRRYVDSISDVRDLTEFALY